MVGKITARCAIPVIGCGGITDGASAQEKIEAGAKLVQIYTGLIYRGPSLLREIGEICPQKTRRLTADAISIVRHLQLTHARRTES